MSDKTLVSNARNYREIGEFWDTHDATEYGSQEPVEFHMDIRLHHRYFAIDDELCLKLRRIAEQRGISEETFLNSIVRERISQIEQGNRIE
uniref:CopG antitoxin of type II toxin-antitoxin system n=1 Tax=Candidatus Kentrum sp. FM TaxID=2126340 RepID=A0A450VLD7_9GAMM|nr:MAG: CopG antitoxin of type II toxin-antitoxin system [Candidatus Kentron sp. FM]VFJ43387.1 MAG: CopG antitoxin of type II toxin-antitoxin system [Candidatus Kentron sp. FM]VFK05527.1 MAG: CopG antitoxin of type II toxin-antitoxin system [Candidatus Kentron sp. FM]